MAGKNNKSASGTKPKVAPQPKKSKGAKASGGGAPVSTGLLIKAPKTSKMRRQGVDLLSDVTVEKSASGIVEQVVISPALFPRLGVIARGFQRIRYHRLRFEIVTGCSTDTSGVYVAGFVKDATDQLTAASASQTLLASQGASTKIWQSLDVVVDGLPDLYYTSIEGGEKRFSSPGSFCIVITAPPDKKVSFLVYVHWDVTLSEDTFEGPKGNQGFHTAKVHLFTSDSNTYLAKRNGASWATATKDDISPPLEIGDYVTLLSFRFPAVKNSSGTTSGTFGFNRLHVSTNGYLYPQDDSAGSTENFDGYTYVIMKGEKFEVSKAPNARASWFRSHRRASSDSPLPSSTEPDSRRPLQSGTETESRPASSSATDCGADPKERITSSHTLLELLSTLNGLLTTLPGSSGVVTSSPSQVLSTESRPKSQALSDDFEMI